MTFYKICNMMPTINCSSYGGHLRPQLNVLPQVEMCGVIVEVPNVLVRREEVLTYGGSEIRERGELPGGYKLAGC